VTELLNDDTAFRHFLAALTLLSRLGDLVSTWVASPTLRLEANPVVRRFGWKFGLLTLLLALVPYYNTSIGVIVLTSSFLVTSSNLAGGWMMRALGEDEMQALLLRVARRSSLRSALTFVWASAAAVGIVGVLLSWLSAPEEWGHYFGWGILVFALAKLLHGSLAMVRLFRRAATVADAEPWTSASAAASLVGRTAGVAMEG
jgi:hypothetical protein